MDDETLTARLADDLDGAFEELVLSHQDRLYSIALRLTGDPRDAEEVAQDAFVRAYRAFAGFDAERARALQLRPWLATIAVNLARNVGRRARSRPSTSALPEAAVPADDPRQRPEALAARRESTERWAGLVLDLPERYRLPVVLRHVDDLSYTEMADVLGRPEGTLKAQVHRGLVLLRAALDAAEREEMTA